MTIKQHGGVFGRNPKFNSVEAESLTIAGDAVPDASTILVDGDIGSTVQGYDADTAKLDAAQTFTAAQTFNENIVMANTKGIDFSATGDGSGTSTSELLDDYEEGEWTPVFIGTTTNGTYTQSGIGRYTKVGDTVTCHFRVNITGVTVAATGNGAISGLPYAVSSDALYVHQFVGADSLADDRRTAAIVADPGTSRAYMTRQDGYTAGAAGLPASDISGDEEITAILVYKV